VPLSIAQRVLRAVRRLGLLDPNGRAVLDRADLPAAVHGATAEVDIAVDQLLTAGELLSAVGSLDASGGLRFPAEPGLLTVPLVIYEPHLVIGQPYPVAPRRTNSVLDARFVRTHAVAGHLRWLGDVGWLSSEDARQAYREDRTRFGLVGPAELPEGYTYVRPFSRGGS
jgi:hypothetical protein